MAKTDAVDINCDMGESFGVYKIGMDEEMISHISSANIACGFHAGDPDVMRRTVNMAVENRVGIGAHPSFPDLKGFGRRKMNINIEEVKNLVTYQIGALAAFARSSGSRLQHVKPHGALNNMAATDYELAEAVALAIKEFNPDLIYVAMCNSAMYRAGRELGLKTAGEAFADRAYQKDGTLVSRSRAGAVLEDPQKINERVIRMVKEGEVESIEGEVIKINPDTICVHGDNSNCVAIAENLVKAIEAAEIEIKTLAHIV